MITYYECVAVGMWRCNGRVGSSHNHRAACKRDMRRCGEVWGDEGRCGETTHQSSSCMYATLRGIGVG